MRNRRARARAGEEDHHEVSQQGNLVFYQPEDLLQKEIENL